MYTKILFLIVILCPIANADTLLTSKIKLYNSRVNNIDYYIKRYHTDSKWRILADYIELKKPDKLPLIKIAKKKAYYIKSGKTVVQFTPKMSERGKIFVGKSPFIFKDYENTNKIIKQVKASVKEKEMVTAIMIFLAEDILTLQYEY